MFLLPFSTQAAVTLSEVAWMGSVASANHEWIELHNDGAAVDVTGWMVTDGMNVEIPLAGTIPAGAYVVLERTSDETVSGTAFLVYTGALVNTGATLSLKRTDGSLEDQVSGGENWQSIGGDNVTKETAQYTNKGWVTAAATPGRAATASEAPVAAADTTETTTTQTTAEKTTAPSRKSSTETVRLVLPDVTLQLKIDAQTVGYVHQPITLEVTPSGIGDALKASLLYEWNFGDGMTAAGKEVTHTYDYPGTYVVTVYGGFKRQEQVARQEITILPVTVSLTTNDGGDVQVNNDSPYELDISGYQIKASKSFTFPARSILLPGATITIPHKKVTTKVGEQIMVQDTAGVAVATRFSDHLAVAEPAVTNPSRAPIMSVTSYVPLLPVSEIPPETFSFTNTAAAAVEPVEKVPEVKINQVAAGGAAPLPANTRWPYIALAATLLLATVGLYVAPRRNETS